MVRLLNRKDNDILLGSAKDTLGFSKDGNSIFQNFLIKIYDFFSITQIDDIKKELMGRKILIIDAKKILQNKTTNILDLKKSIDELKIFLREIGGSLGRIGDQYLILTPNSTIKIAN